MALCLFYEGHSDKLILRIRLMLSGTRKAHVMVYNWFYVPLYYTVQLFIIIVHETHFADVDNVKKKLYGTIPLIFMNS